MRTTDLTLEAKEERLMRQHGELMLKMDEAPEEEKDYWCQKCRYLAKEMRNVRLLIAIRNDVEEKATA
jgi:hypothetical protein